ncbi:splicing factor 3B subunit 2 isoform X1 [Selaginella moellendorffii]|uniref:splicing factor 3B subunit 2 isoform X1 n=1 Tax=Selaginella moellendorffii TaxID=88036 RepID=UPI000D1C6709|nr:splicing factor 3B subunit 2 isoform X1 [Selaginella moellendorffii]|eukprot:XP_024534102.1 splicing factor 3B subunit 2 isoform X1 [Selaginella moellendorffii]
MAMVASPCGADASSTKRAREAEKRRRRRMRKKENPAAPRDSGGESKVNAGSAEIEYVPDKSPLDGDGLVEFQRIFDKFSGLESSKKKPKEAVKTEKMQMSSSEDEDDKPDVRVKEVVLSNKKKKVDKKFLFDHCNFRACLLSFLQMKRRMTVADLKDYCGKPDVVEVWDATAADPRLLVFLKAYRNTVPVPRHWCQKRKFLQGKRGVEKLPFHLPEFIASTGIQKIRQAYIDKENTKKSKQVQRSRMQPKVGKMSIDYQILHDAFFKYQTKPKLTSLGDLYHEGKEFEIKLRNMRPGYLSRELRSALGMDDGAPPPWLFNMQRYGPPPSYPQLRIPGLNAPIPVGASFGYHPGGWGRAPVDEYGRPLYGDLFGAQRQELVHYEEEPVDRFNHWGELEDEDEEEEEGPEEEQREEVEAAPVEEASVASLETPAGDETPNAINLRKSKRSEPDIRLYQVLEEKKESARAGILLGNTHTYALPSVEKPGVKKVDLLKSQRTGNVDITLLPEELEKLDETALAARFEEARKEKQQETVTEDFSDMVASAEKKRKRKAEKDSRAKKVDFKF